ncbi:glucose-1-phosphate adenylyltransferase subunit GlgD [Bacillus marinisedimentorum]|uniref:glucose-1-phosphate adenylyltransferase subunit GlgD n=1 Tax=Bacillus marinisedimentorum TaxID=1821260 RepID=UPI0007DEA5AC|nr:glucose-1-phosphate adenylyltransferase subunit GlgD [Bacillus marinisedimentorum]
MKNVMGVINLGNEPEILGTLTKERSLASVPFGGRYRLIDFSLSNMVNSGIFNVGIFTLRKYRSLMDHLGPGKEWDLDRQNKGLFILPPTGSDKSSDRGDFHLFKEHISYFKRSKEEYVLATQGHLVWNVDFNEIVKFHQDNGADITVAYTEYDNGTNELPSLSVLGIDEESRVHRIDRNTIPYEGDNIYMQTFVIKRELLLEFIEKVESDGNSTFLESVLIPNLDRLNVAAWQYRGYAPLIYSIDSYYRKSMALLDPNISQQLFFTTRPIYTKVKHEPPAQYRRTADVHNSMVANGCTIEGTVENSILFRGVKVHKGAVVKNSIIMQKTEIQEGAYVENAILDKDTKVQKGQQVKGAEDLPSVIAKSSVVESSVN